MVGLVHLKDLFLQGGEEARDLRRVVRPPLLVPETLAIDRMLARFQRSRTHLAMVIDEYGGTSGIVTVEDVVEELIGEILPEGARA